MKSPHCPGTFIPNRGQAAVQATTLSRASLRHGDLLEGMPRNMKSHDVGCLRFELLSSVMNGSVFIL